MIYAFKQTLYKKKLYFCFLIIIENIFIYSLLYKDNLLFNLFILINYIYLK